MTATAPATCIHGPACQRIHVGDRVKVVYGESQIGYGQTGVVTADTDHGHYTVRFDSPAKSVVIARETGQPEEFLYLELNYSEAELDRI